MIREISVACGIAFCSVLHAAEPPQQTRAAALVKTLQARRAAIHTVRLRMDVETRRPEMTDADKQAYAQQLERELESLPQIEGAAREAWRADIPFDVVIESLNRRVPVRRTAVFDVDRLRLRTDDTDQRDIAALVAEHRLDFQQQLTLDQSRAQVHTRSLHLMLLENATPKPLAVLSDAMPGMLDTELAALGFLPPNATSGEDTLQAAREGDALRLTAKHRHGGRTEFVVDAASHALRSLRVYAADGKLAQSVTNSDFREVGGVTLPFRSTIERPQIEMIETRIVREAHVNEPIDGAALFRIPDGYYVQDLRDQTRIRVQDLPSLLLGDSVAESAEGANSGQ